MAAARKVQTAAAARTRTVQERDRLIVEAYHAGGGVREIARHVGLSHPVVLDILKRAEGQDR